MTDNMGYEVKVHNAIIFKRSDEGKFLCVPPRILIFRNFI